MSDLTDSGRNAITDLSARYGLSHGAVEHMARAVANGGGTMAQFNVPELGGSGQWMAGGMTMVGDMFNSGLRSTVANLCGELANQMTQTVFFARPQTLSGGAWWPSDLGAPSSSGGQNGTRYAYFPQAQRIAFDPGTGGPVILLDTRDHRIGGFGQQQSGPGDPFMGISFSSQYGQFPLSTLLRVGGSAQPEAAPPPPQDQPPAWAAPASVPDAPEQGVPRGSGAGEDILGTIERLARLRDMGALTDEEFSRKKSELLGRL